MDPRIIAVMSLVALTACNDTTAQLDPPEGLVAVEIEALVALVVDTGLFPTPPPASDPWPCPAGGTASRTLVFTSPLPGTIEREGTVTLDACATTSPGGVLTTTGSVTLDDRFVQEDGAFTEAAGSYVSSLDWTLGDRSGTCPLQLAVSALNGGLRVSGTACGVAVARDVR
ncbi:MAG: hypothetical protein RJQ04_20640 [Longimicrobiales bacterium]